ncbi:hypothetical protein NQ317_015109 [Molorchus minor]|uniref:DUF4806 domain-containing protein n=1 Tax=Molorchus minor TaxID=1323400 RepID=A0ABQ9K6G7_9CUCU|nr:hypothetical protein NQ317_015109 [Molorchus minor]
MENLQDNYEDAQKKIKKAEITSDIQSEDEDELYMKRKRQAPNRFSPLSTSDEEESSESRFPHNKRLCPRPPKINNPLFSADTPRARTTKQQSQLGVSSPTIQNQVPPSPRVNSQSIFASSSTDLSINEVLTCSSTLSQNYNEGINKETNEELERFETYLIEKSNSNALSSYLSLLGGRDIAGKTNNILRFLLTNSLASTWSFCGKRQGKQAFQKLNLKHVIIRAVRTSSLKLPIKTLKTPLRYG